MNCREYIVELEERGTLSELATLHLTICADCRKMSERQTQIWLMTEELPPVSAPSDFDFHVRARIANAKPSDFQSARLLPILRYVLPLSVVVLLFGLFAFNSTYFFDGQSSTQIAQTTAGTSPTYIESAVDSLESPLASNEAERKVPVAEEFAANVGLSGSENAAQYAAVESLKRKRTRTPNPKVDADSEITSRDTALTGIKPPILPAGIKLNENTVNVPKIENQKPIDDGEILNITGIKFVTEDGKRKVTEVRQNSLAERSGVKVGDVIEELKNNLLKISRGLEKLEISLRSNAVQ